MAYTKTSWTVDDPITADKLNNLETQYDEAKADYEAGDWTVPDTVTSQSEFDSKVNQDLRTSASPTFSGLSVDGGISGQSLDIDGGTSGSRTKIFAEDEDGTCRLKKYWDNDGTPDRHEEKWYDGTDYHHIWANTDGFNIGSDLDMNNNTISRLGGLDMNNNNINNCGEFNRGRLKIHSEYGAVHDYIDTQYFDMSESNNWPNFLFRSENRDQDSIKDMLFICGEHSRLGIRTTSPEHTLDIDGTFGVKGYNIVNTDGQVRSTTTNGKSWIVPHGLIFKVASSNFSNHYNNDSHIDWSDVKFDPHNTYDTTYYEWRPPVDGWYRVTIYLALDYLDDDKTGEYGFILENLDGDNPLTFMTWVETIDSFRTIGSSFVCYMHDNDKHKLRFKTGETGAQVIGTEVYSCFAIELIRED